MSRSFSLSLLALLLVLMIVVLSSGCLNELDPTCGKRLEVENKQTLTTEQPRAALYTPAAKKECHAVMYIEFEYARQDLKVTQGKPPVWWEFGTTNGIFPNTVAKMESKTIGKDTTAYYWYATTSQGAKNTAGDSTSYHIIAGLPAVVRDSSPESEVQVRMMIEYTPVSTG